MVGLTERYVFGLVMKQEKLRFLTTPINEMIGVILGAVLADWRLYCIIIKRKLSAIRS